MTSRREVRRGRSKRKAARIASGAVVGLGLALMVYAVFGDEYGVYAVLVGAILGGVLGGLTRRGRRGRGVA